MCNFTKGLRVGDEVIEFGSVNTENFQNLQNIASVVQHSEGVSYCNISLFASVCHIAQPFMTSRLYFAEHAKYLECKLHCHVPLQKPLRVLVIRDGQRAQMSLTPQRWSGRGLLG